MRTKPLEPIEHYDVEYCEKINWYRFGGLWNCIFICYIDRLRHPKLRYARHFPFTCYVDGIRDNMCLELDASDATSSTKTSEHGARSATKIRFT